MDIRKLKTILDLFEHSSLTEIEFCEGEERIRLCKSAPAPAAAPRPPPSAAAPAPPPPAGEAAAAEDRHDDSDTAAGTLVKSPIVGTFYRAASPEKEPFVAVGSKVKKGDTLCIVEAMKLMNEIPSPLDGTVTTILADNGEPVGFGAKLFIIE